MKDILQGTEKKKVPKNRNHKEKELYPLYLALENTKGIGKKIAADFLKNYEKACREIGA